MFDKWFFIFLSVVAICIACGVIFGTIYQDPMTQQIHEINNLFPYDKESEARSKLVSELIQKHQPATANVSVKLKQ